MSEQPLLSKTGLRSEYKQRRASLTSEQRVTYSKLIYEKLLTLPAVAAAKNLFVYISCGSEVDTHAFIDELLRQNKTIAVPKIEPSREMIAVAFRSWDDCRPAELGILTPTATARCALNFDVAITPGIAFTRTGTRLGFGAGYYDKWFSKNTVQQKIAVAFDCQLSDWLPQEPFDVPVDLIVTEREIIDPSKGTQ